jgi:hypothetical protein
MVGPFEEYQERREGIMDALTGNLDGNLIDGADIPACVHNALENWDELVFNAFDWHVKHGRLAVGIEADENDLMGAKLCGILYEQKGDVPPSDAAGLINSYDPDWEIVIQFVDTAGRLRTQRLRTAPGGRHPRRVWYFEMMRRLQEEPETVDLITLPDWFIESLEKLEAMRKAREAESQK